MCIRDRLVAEQAARSRNKNKIQEVIDKVVDDALAGNENMMKLVWQSVISKGSSEETAGKEKMTIEINTGPKEDVTVIEQPPEINEERVDEQIVSDER